MSDSVEGKYCPDCRSELPVSSFTKDVRRRDGLAFYCRPCRIARDEISRRRRLGPRRNKVCPRDLGVPDDHKWCPDCEAIKPLSDFPRNNRARNGHMTYCRPCHNTRTKVSVAAHGGARNYHLRRRYGITAEHFDQMFAEQGGLCAICLEAPAEHVDHDHRTNRVRGLLCFNCNGALGQFRDRVELMGRAVAYLIRDENTSATDLSTIHFGLHIGDFESRRPPEESDAA